MWVTVAQILGGMVLVIALGALFVWVDVLDKNLRSIEITAAALCARVRKLEKITQDLGDGLL